MAFLIARSFRLRACPFARELILSSSALSPACIAPKFQVVDYSRPFCEKAAEKGEEAKPQEVKDEDGATQSEEAHAESKVAELEAKVQELEEQVKDRQDQLLRALADTENMRRRSAIDVDNAHKYAVTNFAKELLEVADNLGRATENVPEDAREGDANPQLKALYEGVVLTDQILMKVFQKNGVERMSPVGEPFDPNFHNALFQMPPGPDLEPGTVANVQSAGYTIHDRCLRAAGVGIVSKT